MTAKSAAAFLALAGAFVEPSQAETIDIMLREGTNMAAAVSVDGTVVLDVQGTIWRLDAGGNGVALTDGLGDDRQPSFSPDGRRIAFQSYRDGLFHLWSIGIDGEGLERLTNGEFDDREPAWSPDGKSIAFSSDRSGNYDIWVVELTSGQLRRKTTHQANDYNPAWSPDGREIVFVSERRSSPGIYLTSVTKGDGPAQLLRSAVGRLAAPSFSPDGRRVVWQSLDRAAGTSALVVLDKQTGLVAPASAAGDDVFPFRVAWLSDERFLYTANGALYQSSFAANGRSVRPFRLPVRLERPQYTRRNRLSERRTRALPVRGIVVPAASPDGSRVAFTALGDLWVRQLDGHLEQLTSGPAVEAHPAFSPDGRYLAYISDQAGDMDVWVTDLESVGSRRLTDLPGGEAFPVFSPDGARIAFFAEQVGQFLRSQIRIVDLTSGRTSPSLSATMPPVQLDWSPDGERLTGLVLDPNSTRFREGSFRLFELTVANGDIELFGPLHEQTMFHARPSPDGRWLAWVAGARLWLAPFEGGRVSGDKRPLTEGLADWPTWSGDSKGLAFLAGDRLRRVTLDGEIEDLPIELDWLPEAVPGPAVVHAGRLFDGRSETLQTNVDVVIQGGRIRAIEPHSDARHVAVRVIDAAGRTVMPGLFEMHGHQGITTGEVQGRRWLAFGVTSVREPGTGPYDGAERRESWASGRRIGPRNFFSGWLLDGGRVYYSLAEGTQDMEHLERALERARLIGYDLLKTYVRLPDAAQKRALAAAHEMGIPTSSHEIFPAAASGMDAVEHLGATSRRGYSPKISLLGRVYDDVIEIVAKARLNMTPTLVLPCFWPHLASHHQVLDHPVVQVFLSPDERRSHLSRGESMRTPAMAARCAATRSVGEIVARGGRITAGTDSPIVPYGLALHIELQLLVEAGLTPLEALRSATLWAAEAVGVGADLGSIEVGKLADLIVVEGDPLKNIAHSINVVVTLKGGRVYEREALFEPAR